MARSDIRNVIGNLLPSGRLDNHGAANAYALTRPVNEIPDPVETGIKRGLASIAQGISNRVDTSRREEADRQALAIRKRDMEKDAQEREAKVKQSALDRIKADAGFKRALRSFKDTSSVYGDDLMLGREEFFKKHGESILGFDVDGIEDEVLRESYRSQYDEVLDTAFSGAATERFSRERLGRAEEYADEYLNDGDGEELANYFKLTSETGMREDEQWSALMASVTRQVESGNTQALPNVEAAIDTVKDLDLRASLKKEFKTFDRKRDVVDYVQKNNVNLALGRAKTEDEVDRLAESFGYQSHSSAINEAYKRVQKADTLDDIMTSVDLTLNETLRLGNVAIDDDIEIELDGKGGVHKMKITPDMVNKRIAETVNKLRVDRDDAQALGKYQEFLTSNYELPSTVTSEYKRFVGLMTSFDPNSKNAGEFMDNIKDNINTFDDLGNWIANTGNVNTVIRQMGISPSSREGVAMQLYDTLVNTQNVPPEDAWRQANRMLYVKDTAAPMEKEANYTRMLEGNANVKGVYEALQLDGVQKQQAQLYVDYAKRFMTADELKTQLNSMYGDANEVVDGYRINNFPAMSNAINKMIGRDYSEDVQPNVVIKDMLKTLKFKGQELNTLEDSYSNVTYEEENGNIVINGSFDNEDDEEERRMVVITPEMLKEFVSETYADQFLTTENMKTVNRKYIHTGIMFGAYNKR